MKRFAAFIFVLLSFGCAQLHVHRPFSDVNTMVMIAGKTNAPMGSTKAVVIAYRQTPGQEQGVAQPKTPKVFVVNFDELRDMKFVDRGVRVGAHAMGDVYCREKILVFRRGYEPAWLEKKLVGQEYLYPRTLALVPCRPVRSRRLTFDAISHVFRDEPESVRQSALKKLARELD
jgi:hypothetical protein